MPIKLIPPRQGRSKNWRIRGTYLKQYVDESAGTADQKLARKKLQQIRAEIERGEFTSRSEPTFVSDAVAYIEAGGDARFLGHFDESIGKWTGLIAHFGETPRSRIDQTAIDSAAVKLYPDATPATRNRQVYTPVSAVLKHAGVDRKLRRPAGAQGEERVDWLWPEQAFAVLSSAAKVDKEWRIFLAALLYTGMRLREATEGLLCDNTSVAENYARIEKTKNGKARPIHLPPGLVAELANHPRGLDRPGETVFRFRKNGALYTMLRETFAAAGVTLPRRVAFHIFCHTWATWMRRYGGSDTQGLIATQRWRDPKSAARYAHVVVSEEATRADRLPTPPIRAKSVERKRRSLK